MYDPGTGFHDYGARLYWPEIGRFISADSVMGSQGSPMTLNRYSYVLNNPYKYTDPTGHAVYRVNHPEPISPAAGRAVAGLAATSVNEHDNIVVRAGAAVLGTVLSLFTPETIGKTNTVMSYGAMALGAVRARGGGALPDEALVCRGGSCTADRFARGSGVTVGPDGELSGVSVNSASGATLEELTATSPYPRVGVATVGQVRSAGGDVVPSGSASNPTHATMSGVTAAQAEKIFTPTVANPNK